MGICFQNSTYLQYNGTNSAAILDMINIQAPHDWSIESEVGGVLTLAMPNEEYPTNTDHKVINNTDYLVRLDNNVFTQLLNATDFAAMYTIHT